MNKKLVFILALLLIAWVSVCLPVVGAQARSQSAEPLVLSARNLATSPEFPGLIVTALSGMHTPVYSFCQGKCWLPLGNAPWSQDPSRVALTSRLDGAPRFLAVVNGDALYRSGDHGISWARHAFTIPSTGCNYPAEFDNLEVSPADPRYIYLTYTCWYDDGMASAAYADVYASSDRDLTWTRVRGGGGEPRIWLNLFASPVVAARVFVMDGTATWNQSDNSGEHWTARIFPVNMLVADTQDANRLYGVKEHTASGDIGRSSSDGGATWNDWAQNPCPEALDDKQLLAHPTQAGGLLMLCHHGLYRSLDDGDSWQQLSTFTDGTLYRDEGYPGRLLWLRGGGLYASSDVGTSWQTLVSNWTLYPACQQVHLPQVAR